MDEARDALEIQRPQAESESTHLHKQPVFLRPPTQGCGDVCVWLGAPGASHLRLPCRQPHQAAPSSIGHNSISTAKGRPLIPCRFYFTALQRTRALTAACRKPARVTPGSYQDPGAKCTRLYEQVRTTAGLWCRWRRIWRGVITRWVLPYTLASCTCAPAPVGFFSPFPSSSAVRNPHFLHTAALPFSLRI